MTSTPLLLALCGPGDDGGWPWSSRSEAGRAVVGAALFELAREGRLELSDDRVVPCGGGPTGDGVQDQLLGRVSRAGRARAPWVWMELLGPDALRHVEEECAHAAAPGALRRRVGEARAQPGPPAWGKGPDSLCWGCMRSPSRCWVDCGSYDTKSPDPLARREEET
ncbi:GPP34 family phosphoprotein [Streptomyces sp. TP-A0356]|uniref:GPP34 family phosphoprotein n=1 Tax=Streptomyces sp. TP-A0356 TaxID=1359208 RepID=UPI0006E1DED8|nr:GPP34 family phosphoprotein [Streptomyces sp. TP-A0356]